MSRHHVAIKPGAILQLNSTLDTRLFPAGQGQQYLSLIRHTQTQSQTRPAISIKYIPTRFAYNLIINSKPLTPSTAGISVLIK